MCIHPKMQSLYIHKHVSRQCPFIRRSSARCRTPLVPALPPLELRLSPREPVHEVGEQLGAEHKIMALSSH